MLRVMEGRSGDGDDGRFKIGELYCIDSVNLSGCAFRSKTQRRVQELS